MTELISERYAATVRAARRAYKTKRRIALEIKELLHQTDTWREYRDARADCKDAYDAMLRAEEQARTEGNIYLPWE